MRQQTPEISVATDDEREGWAVVSLSGSLDSAGDAESIDSVLGDLVADHHLVGIDARAVERMCPQTHRVLAAAAPVFRSCGGGVVVSGLTHRDRFALGVLDVRRELLMVSR